MISKSKCLLLIFAASLFLCCGSDKETPIEPDDITFHHHSHTPADVDTGTFITDIVVIRDGVIESYDIQSHVHKHKHDSGKTHTHKHFHTIDEN